MFDWDDLRVFLAVARSRKIAPAARMLGVEHTTVTRRLARLGAALGADLFEASAGERVLTERGRTLLVFAETVESAAHEAREALSGEDRRLSGHVRLSVSEGFGTWVLAPHIARFRLTHPDIRLDLVTASGFLNPSKREADMAIMLARPKKGRLLVRKLGSYALRLYASRDYLARAGEPSGRPQLHHHPLVGYVPEFIYSPELDYLGEVESDLDPHYRATSINIQHRIIAAGGGIGILPDFIGMAADDLVPVLAGEVAITRSFWAVTHSDMSRLARIQAVSQWLDDCVAGNRSMSRS